jgi:hypothetical protein
MQRDELGRLWVVIRTEHKREPVANMNLLQAGYDTFFVHYMHMARHGPKVWRQMRSYFPGYLFAAIEEPVQIAPIARVRAVAEVLWSPSDQHYLPPKWLSAMRAECLNGNGLHEPPANGLPERGRFKSGERVHCRGAWDKFAATVLRDTGKTVQVDHGEMFGKRIIATYDPVQVEPA